MFATVHTTHNPRDAPRDTFVLSTEFELPSIQARFALHPLRPLRHCSSDSQVASLLNPLLRHSARHPFTHPHFHLWLSPSLGASARLRARAPAHLATGPRAGHTTLTRDHPTTVTDQAPVIAPTCHHPRGSHSLHGHTLTPGARPTWLPGRMATPSYSRPTRHVIPHWAKTASVLGHQAETGKALPSARPTWLLGRVR